MEGALVSGGPACCPGFPADVLIMDVPVSGRAMVVEASLTGALVSGVSGLVFRSSADGPTSGLVSPNQDAAEISAAFPDQDALHGDDR